MDCSSGCLTTPALKERKKKEREKENDKSGLCVIWQARHGGLSDSFPSERLPETRGKRQSALQNPWEASGTESCFLCKVGVELPIVRLTGGAQRLMRLQV